MMEGMTSPTPLRKYTYVFGDLHGNMRALGALLDRLSPTQRDRLVFLGDYVDYGPQSSRVLDEVRGASRYVASVRAVAGNHDCKHARYAAAKKAGDSVRLASFQTGEAFLGIHASLSEEHLAWLADLPLCFRLGRYFVSHAGLPPRLELPAQYENLRAAALRSSDPLGQLMRVRFLNEKDEPIPLGKETSGARYWADVYAGRYGFALFGHERHRKVAYYRHAVALDTGCGKGGRLSVLEIDEEDAHRILSVDTDNPRDIRIDYPGGPDLRLRDFTPEP